MSNITTKVTILQQDEVGYHIAAEADRIVSIHATTCPVTVEPGVGQVKVFIPHDVRYEVRTHADGNRSVWILAKEVGK